MKQLQLAGQRFGRWIVEREAGLDKHGSYMWLCKCDCGNEKVVNGQLLRRGKSRSCGCFQREVTALRFGASGYLVGRGARSRPPQWK
jgi:hypothetical protein